MEKKTNDWSQILWSLVVLVAVLAFLYTIFFWIEKPAPSQALVSSNTVVDWYELWNAEEPIVETGQPIIQQVQIQAEDDIASVPETQPVQPAPTKTIINSNPVVEQWKTFFSVQDLFNTVEVSPDWQVPLSWTFLWEWSLRSLVDFGLIGQEEYVLKTIFNSHFAYLWSFDNENIPLLDNLGWNIVEITEKNDIQGHGLFWDRIRFLNTDRYKKFEKVIFIVFFDKTNDARFVQLDRDRYYAAKLLIRNTFDQRYDW